MVLPSRIVLRLTLAFILGRVPGWPPRVTAREFVDLFLYERIGRGGMSSHDLPHLFVSGDNDLSIAHPIREGKGNLIDCLDG